MISLEKTISQLKSFQGSLRNLTARTAAAGDGETGGSADTSPDAVRKLRIARLWWWCETVCLLGVITLLIALDEVGFLSRVSASLFALIIISCLVFLIANLRAAAFITACLMYLIAAISWTKINFMDVPFVVNDLIYLTGHSFWVTMGQYKLLAVSGATGLLIVGLAVAVIVQRCQRRTAPAIRGSALFVAIILTYAFPEVTRNAFIWDPMAERTSGSVSSFTNSLVSSLVHGSGEVTFANVGPIGLTLSGNEEFNAIQAQAKDTSVSAGTTDRPDVVMILDESVFDPRDLNLPHQPDIDEHFSPSEGVSGRLNVNVHGGGTWVSEYGAITGLETRSFGDQAHYLPVLMAGRVKHSLMTHLKKLGYETIVFYCMNGSFMNAENNYRSLGADRFEGVDKKHIPGMIWLTRDRELYQSALDHIDRVKQSSGKPVFALIVTIYNHGPHMEDIATGGDQQDVLSWLADEVPGADMAPYREYYRRLQYNMQDYRWLKKAYESRFPERSLVVSHYGDHQPKFSKDIINKAPENRPLPMYTTRFGIEGINRPLAPVPDWGEGNLDIAYLPSLVLAAANLERDEIFAARLELLERCQGLYAECQDPLKGRIHRTLIDKGLVDVDRILDEQPVKLVENNH